MGWGSFTGVGNPEFTPRDRDRSVPYALVMKIVISEAVLVALARLTVSRPVVLLVTAALVDATTPCVHGVATVKVMSVRIDMHI